MTTAPENSQGLQTRLSDPRRTSQAARRTQASRLLVAAPHAEAGVLCRLTVGPEEGWREEALVHQAGERDHADHVVGVKAQAAERLTAQLLGGETQPSPP